MKFMRFLLFRVFALIGFITLFLYLSYGQEQRSANGMVRDAAWNDFLQQFLPTTENHYETFRAEIVVIQSFLNEHPSGQTAEIYDSQVLGAIDRARSRLQKADKDLEVIRRQLTHTEYQVKGGR